MKKLRKYTERPEFDPDVMRKSSGAAAALAVWVRAIELYATVAPRGGAKASGTRGPPRRFSPRSRHSCSVPRHARSGRCKT